MYQLVSSGRRQNSARFPVILVSTFLCPIYKLLVSSVSSGFGRCFFPFFFFLFFERLAFFPWERHYNLGTKTGTGLSVCRHKT